MLETLKEWKVAITSVGQRYESTEGCQDYKTGTGTTYVWTHGKGMLIGEEGTRNTNMF